MADKTYIGRIIKAMSGFYYVRPEEDQIPLPEDDKDLYRCRAKGIFRKKKVTPLVGDRVKFSITETEEVEGNISEILKRRNSLIRPRVANLDQALVIFAFHTPEPALGLLDRFLVEMQREGIDVVLVFNKDDLRNGDEAERYRDIYKDAGVKLIFTSAVKGTGIEELREILSHRVSAVAGPSGAGKSSVINALIGEDSLTTGELSKKIMRGKQTTRHTELVEIGRDSYIIDTPGFSSLDLTSLSERELPSFFPEIRGFGDSCYYKDCSHINEPGCEVRKSMELGLIPRERYDSYVSIYEELKGRLSRVN